MKLIPQYLVYLMSAFFSLLNVDPNSGSQQPTLRYVSLHVAYTTLCIILINAYSGREIQPCSDRKTPEITGTWKQYSGRKFSDFFRWIPAGILLPCSSEMWWLSRHFPALSTLQNHWPVYTTRDDLEITVNALNNIVNSLINIVNNQTGEIVRLVIEDMILRIP